jgi:hypothetical protein
MWAHDIDPAQRPTGRPARRCDRWNCGTSAERSAGALPVTAYSLAEPATPLPLPAGPLSVELDAVGFGYPAADKVSRSLRPG